MTLIRTLLLPAILVAHGGLSPRLFAQVDGTYDPTFEQGSGFPGIVVAIERQPDGKLLVGGSDLGSYDGVEVPPLVRLWPDGALDTGFDTGEGPDHDVLCVALQANGRILVGGSFQQFDGVLSEGLVRLMPDGSIDATFDIGTAANDRVRSVLVQPDGRILVGGDFDQFNGTPVGRIVRLMPDGSIDPSFNAGTGANDEVIAITQDASGRTIVGGYFTTFTGIARNKVARLNADGSLDQGFDPGVGTGEFYQVFTLAALPDGKLLVGGDFITWDGETSPSLVRLEADGSLDPGFDASTSIGFATVSELILYPDGHFLACGSAGVKLLSNTGEVDPGFDTGAGFFGGLQAVLDIELLPDGRLIAGGQFDEYDGYLVGSIVRLTSADVGLEEMEGNGLALWPNPTCGPVRFATEVIGEGLRIRVLDGSGREVGVRQRTTSGELLELPPMPGIYVVEAEQVTGRRLRGSVIRE